LQGSGVALLGGEQNARAGRIEPWLAVTFLVLAAVILYSISWTLPAWSEGGSFQLKAILGYFALPELDAITHPGYVVLAGAIYRATGALGAINLLSVVPAALVGTFIMWFAARSGTSRHVALLLAISFLTTHSFAWNATITKVYPLHLLCVVVEFSLLRKFWAEQKPGYFVLAALISGFALSVHQLEGFTILSVAVAAACFRRGRPSLPTLAVAAVAFAIGFMPALAFFLPKLGSLHDTIEQARRFLVGDWGGRMLSSGFSRGGWEGRVLVAFSFVGFAQLRGLQMIPTALRSGDPEATFLVVLAVSSSLFVFTYDTNDAFTLTGPALLALYCLAARSGMTVRPRQIPLLFLQPIVIAIGLLLTEIGVLSGPYRDRLIPYRDDLHYVFNPVRNGQENGPSLLFDELLAAGADARTGVLSHWVTGQPLAVIRLLRRSDWMHVIGARARFISLTEAGTVCKDRPGLERLFVLHPDDEFRHHVRPISEHLYEYRCPTAPPP
jgi:hypothetical protein